MYKKAGIQTLLSILEARKAEILPKVATEGTFDLSQNVLPFSQNVQDLIGIQKICLIWQSGGITVGYTQGILPCNLEGSNHSGRKRRFASRHFQGVGCFRISKKPKIFVSVAVEMFLQNEYQNSGKCTGMNLNNKK